MASLVHFTFDLWETINAAHIIDDSTLDHRLLSRFINTQRAMWLKRKFDAINDYDTTLIQSVNLDLTIIDPVAESSFKSGIGNNISSNPYQSNIRILKSVNPIPSIIELNHGNAIADITGPDWLNTTISVLSFGQFKVAGNGRFNRNGLFATLKDGYLYIKYGSDASNLNVLNTCQLRAIFNDPTEIPGFDYYDSVYPLNENYWPYIKDMIIKNDLRYIMNGKEDDVNDDKDQSMEQKVPIGIEKYNQNM